jgi:hypothetical protein
MKITLLSAPMSISSYTRQRKPPKEQLSVDKTKSRRIPALLAAKQYYSAALPCSSVAVRITKDWHLRFSPSIRRSRSRNQWKRLSDMVRMRYKRRILKKIFFPPAATSGLSLSGFSLAARGESTIGRVPSAAGADARRRDAGDTGISSRSANAADAPAPPEPFGRIGIAGNLCVAHRQRCPRIASSSRLDLARNTYARDLLYFHHGLLDNLQDEGLK